MIGEFSDLALDCQRNDYFFDSSGSRQIHFAALSPEPLGSDRSKSSSVLDYLPTRRFIRVRPHPCAEFMGFCLDFRPVETEFGTPLELAAELGTTPAERP